MESLFPQYYNVEYMFSFKGTSFYIGLELIYIGQIYGDSVHS